MTKGFQYTMRCGNHTWFITNNVKSKSISFIVGENEKHSIDLTDYQNTIQLDMTEDQFITLVERLQFEADKIRTREKKKENKTVLEFGEKKCREKK